MRNSQKFPIKIWGKPEWIPLLTYLADLHEGSFHAPLQGLPYRWEEIAPQTELGGVFGHWDSVHIACDALSLDPHHGIHQIINNIALQQPNGLIPGHIGIVNNRLKWGQNTTSPPLWPMVLQEYVELTGNVSILSKCYPVLEKQIHWFEAERQNVGQGFYYLDCLDRFWESGVEEGVRYEFGSNHPEELACIDATSHVYSLYDHAERWARLIGIDASTWENKKEKLRTFIQTELFDEETGFFHDQWMINHPQIRKLAFEGIWPLVAGAASSEQAHRVINENLLDPTRFFTPHPIPTVGIQDPCFEYHFWRGPTRNSMTYWAAKGCLKYNRPDASCILLEKALDATNCQFQRTGKIWEFYHPEGGDPRGLSRKKGTHSTGPFTNYLGHNPLIAMSKLWETIKFS